MREEGAEALLEKNVSLERFLAAVQRAACGEAFCIEPRTEPGGRKEVDTTAPNLSRRERDVLQKLVEGDDNKTIAVALGITVNTVEKHLSNIYRKLGVRSRVEAVQRRYRKTTDSRN